MSISNGRVTAPIGLAEVYSLLGVVPKNGIYDVAEIVMSPQVNPDSLYKPYEYDSPDNPEFADGGEDGYYGYDIPMTTNPSILSIMRSKWAFRDVSQAGWKRMADFENYSHTVRYSQSNWGASLVGDPLNGDTLRVSFNYGNTPYLVSPYNMKIFKGCYMAVQIFGGRSDSINSMAMRWSQCCENTIGSSNGELLTVMDSDFKISDAVTMVIPYISEYKFAKGTAPGTGRKWVLNLDSVRAIRISDQPMQLYLIYDTDLSKAGTYVLTLDVQLYANIAATLYTLYAQVELWSEADCKGTKLYSEQGDTGNDVYRYPQGIALVEGVNTLPTATLAINQSYATRARSVRVYLSDPYNGYEFVAGELNL